MGRAIRLFSLLLIALGGAAAVADQRPNLLIILTDDMGYGDLSCYGSTQIQTPNIDQLFAAGVNCTQGYVSSNVCSPSRAGLLTGRYQNRFGYEDNLTVLPHVKPEWCGIPADQPLVSERLQQGGYRTGIIGKWHLGESVPEHHPNARGFEYFFGFLGGQHGYFPTANKNKLLRNQTPVTEIAEPYLTDWLTSDAINFMNAQDDRPWFLYLSYNTPHAPLQAKEDDLAKYADVKPLKRRTYCAMQDCLDQNIGRLVQAMQENGTWENTLILFCSDNGGSVNASFALNAPLNGMKGMYLEGGVRVPMAWVWPSKLPAGQRYDHPITALDAMPTFLAAADIDWSPELGKKETPRIYDGVDVVPYLLGENRSAPHPQLWWRRSLRGGSIREGDWKLVATGHHVPMLFNLKEDISERRNLAFDHPERLAELYRKLHQWEVSFERDPIFTTGPYWANYNYRLYEKEYQLTQPE